MQRKDPDNFKNIFFGEKFSKTKFSQMLTRRDNKKMNHSRVNLIKHLFSVTEPPKNKLDRLSHTIVKTRLIFVRKVGVHPGGATHSDHVSCMPQALFYKY